MSDAAEGAGAGSLGRVTAALREAGLSVDIERFPEGTRTSADAAAAVGCAVGQIAKSLVFRAQRSDRPVLVIASGANRVDVAAVAAAIGEDIDQARGRWVRERTGFAIGGVAPVGHLEPPIVLIDEDLLAFDEIWAAAGAPDAVFRLTPEALCSITGGTVAAIRET